MNRKADWLLRFTSNPGHHCMEGWVNQGGWKHNVTGWRYVRQAIAVALQTTLRRVDTTCRMVKKGDIGRSWKRLVLAWWHQRRRAGARFRQQISTALWMAALRIDTALRVSKEEQIRAWWRVHQAERGAYWARRGYTDAQLGTNGYPHHGECACACCDAYWSGYTQYGRGGEPSARRASLLGLLSPPPREELFWRVTQHPAMPGQSGCSLHTRSNIYLERGGDHYLTPASEVLGGAAKSMAHRSLQEGTCASQAGHVDNPLPKTNPRGAMRCITARGHV